MRCRINGALALVHYDDAREAVKSNRFAEIGLPLLSRRHSDWGICATSELDCQCLSGDW
jgi:hypothetical protein